MKTALLLWCVLLCSVTTQAQNRIYPLDGNADEIIGGLDGTLGLGIEAPTDTTDRFGTPSGAMYFDGDDHIEIPVTGLTTPEFSVSAWLLVSVNPGSLQMDYYAIGDDTQDQAFGVANDQFGTGFFQAGYVDVGTPVRVFDDTLPSEDVWHHVVVTRSLTELKLYVNGWLVNTTDATGTLPEYGASPIALIGNRYVNLRPWDGIIDDLRIWDRAISEEEVEVVNAVPEAMIGTGPILFPNPVCDQLNVTIPLSTGNRVSLRLIDGMGRVILDRPTSPIPSEILNVPIQTLPAGHYWVELSNDDGTVRLPFIKQ